jgi:N-acetylglucosaminyldiphosphoundecaprenol N-acetyl-beta-D-mannosaminyltransferase
MDTRPSVLGVAVDCITQESVVDRVMHVLTSLTARAEGISIATPNPEQVVMAQHDNRFKNVLNSFDLAIPDGIGIVYALRHTHPEITRVSGIDCMQEIIRSCAGAGVAVGFIGGGDGVAKEAFERCKQVNPLLTGFVIDGLIVTDKGDEVVGGTLWEYWLPKHGKPEVNPPGGPWLEIAPGYASRLIIQYQRRIHKPIMLFIALGAPKQEYFIRTLRESLVTLGRSTNSSTKTAAPVGYMAVGGAIDMLAGRIKRAPGRVQLAELEWLWRLIQEPWRIRRQMALVEYVVRIIVDRGGLLVR